LRHFIQEQIELIHRQERQRLDVLLCPVHRLDEPGAFLLVRLVDHLERRRHTLQRRQRRFQDAGHKCAHRLSACLADRLQDGVLTLVQRNGDAWSFGCHGLSSSVMRPMLVHHRHHSQRRWFGRRAMGGISRPTAASAG